MLPQSQVSPRPVMQPRRNAVEDQAVAAIDAQRRFESFICLLVWNFGRRNRRRRKLIGTFQDIARGIRIGAPGSSMQNASKAAVDQARIRLLAALAESARELATARWVPAQARADFARFEQAIARARRRAGSELTTEDLLEGLAGILIAVPQVDGSRSVAPGRTT